MEMKQFWILIAIGLGCGMFFEIVKGPASAPVRIANMVKLEKLIEEGAPVYIAEAETPSKPKKPVVRPTPAPTPPPPEATPVDPSATPAPSPTPKPTPVDPKKAAADKKKADEKKKKEAEEKKKKKKEAADKAAEEAAASPTPTPSDDNLNGGNAAPATDDVSGTTPQPNPATPGIVSTAPHALSETAAQWEKYLMASADSTRTALFVKDFKAGLIKSTTYYTVIAAMLADARAPMQEQAISALTQTPSSQSYTLLVDTYTKSTDPTVKPQAEAGIQAYTAVANLQYLTSVVVGTDEAAALSALQTIQTSASTYLSATATSTSTGTTSTASVSSYYSALLTSLQSATTKGVDTSVRTSATQTLADLQSMLGNVQVTQN